MDPNGGVWFGFCEILILAMILMKPLALQGIAFANSLSYSIQALGLILLLNHRLPEALKLKGTFFRSILSLILAGLVSWLIFSILPIPLSPLFRSVGAMILGVAVGAIPVWREIRLLLQL